LVSLAAGLLQQLLLREQLAEAVSSVELHRQTGILQLVVLVSLSANVVQPSSEGYELD
jgi:hypothetical protein